MNLLNLMLLFPFIYILSNHVENWTIYKYEEQSFQIELPCSPSEQQYTSPSVFGDLSNFSLSCVANDKKGIDSNTLYMVSCATYPERVISSDYKDYLETYYRPAIDGVVKGVNGRLLYEKKIFSNSYEGRQVKIVFNNEDIGGKNVSRLRLLVIKNKLYVIQTITLPQNDNNIFINKFMDSFKLLAVKKNTIQKKKFEIDSIKIEALNFEITDEIKKIKILKWF